MTFQRDVGPGDPVDTPAVTLGDRIVDDFNERDTGRSNFAAFLLGGVVIAGGLLGFLYYDTDNLTRSDSLTTGSITQTVPGQQPSALRLPNHPKPPVDGVSRQ